MKKIIFLLLLVSAFARYSFAQEPEAYKFRTGLGFVPQYTIGGGLRLDIDRSLSKKTNQWLILSPQVFWVTGNRFGHSFEELKGCGLDVKHKVFLKPGNMKPAGFYVQYGAMFQYYSITENREYGEYYMEDGVQYYGIFEGNVNTGLYKFGGNFHLGYQWLFADKIFIDIYTGAGIRISHNSRNNGFDTWYNNSWVDYGYSGTLLDGAFRVGYYF